MAFETSDLLLKLSPTGYLGGGKPREDMSMERERLALMREQFENTKAQQAQAAELSRLEESGRMARAQLEHQSAMQQLDVKQAEATKAKKLEAYQKFTELNGKGDIEGARAMVPLMSALGMGVDLEGEDDGLPRYRVNMDADAEADAETNQRFQAAKAGDEMGAAGIGYDTNDDSGDLPQEPGISSTADAFGAAQQATRYSEQTGQPYMKPDAPDYTGAVPKNVIDTGAMNSAMQARLNPAMSGIIGGLPAEYQDSARSTASGLGGLGLPAEKTMEMFGKQQGDANALITGGLNREAEAEKAARAEAAAAYAARTKGDGESFDRYEFGSLKFGPDTGKSYDVDNRKKQRVLNTRFKEILDNPIGADDYLILGGIVRGLGEVGAPSNADAARAVGLPATSTWDQIADWVSSRVDGGMLPTAKAALKNVVKKNIEANDAQLKEFSGKLQEMIDDPGTDRDVARGLKDYLRVTIPEDMRAKHEQERNSPLASGGGEKPAEGELSFLVDAEAGINGLNAEAIKRVIQHESGGDPAAVNKDSGATGLIQFMPQTAENLGTTTDELKAMPVEDQVRLVVKYFENAGITAESQPDDYALAVAAPAFVGKPDETVVYPKGSKAWEQNTPWRPADGGDITVGSIKAFYSGGGKEAAPAADTEADARKARLAELRKKYGRTP
jgi:hypothetical protein